MKSLMGMAGQSDIVSSHGKPMKGCAACWVHRSLPRCSDGPRWIGALSSASRVRPPRGSASRTKRRAPAARLHVRVTATAGTGHASRLGADLRRTPLEPQRSPGGPLRGLRGGVLERGGLNNSRTSSRDPEVHDRRRCRQAPAARPPSHWTPRHQRVGCRRRWKRSGSKRSAM